MFGRLGNWWKQWREHATTLAGLREYGDGELSRVASDLGLGVGDLKVLAGKWPDAADPVRRRAAALGLDADAIERAQPEVMRDLQRVCSLCGNKRACGHDLGRAPKAPRWQAYCPNAGTLESLRDIRRRRIE